jgi:heme oxygenase
VARIEELSDSAPELLVGHHYTRYLGDLSGGQILSTIASRAMNLTDGQGLNFYRFEAIDDEKAFKDIYRSALDALAVDQAMADRIVEEANEAFRLNMLMFQELEGNLVSAIGKVLFGFLTRRQRQGSTEAVAAA